jgi:hypothetical protein
LIYSAADLENILLDSNGNCKLSNFRKTLDFIKYSTQQEGNRLDEHTIIPQFFPSDDYSARELLKNYRSVEYSLAIGNYGLQNVEWKISFFK